MDITRKRKLFCTLNQGNSNFVMISSKHLLLNQSLLNKAFNYLAFLILCLEQEFRELLPEPFLPWIKPVAHAPRFIMKRGEALKHCI